MGVKTDVHEVMTKGNNPLQKADKLVTKDKTMEENESERGAKDNEVGEDAKTDLEQERALSEDLIDETHGEEKFDEPEEEKSEMREGKVGSRMCERGKRGNKVDGEKESELRSPTTGTRPVRVIKSIPRLIDFIERDVVREFYVQEGYGTPLKDIPNVAYKLSKRENDDTLKLLHTILFSRRGKAAEIQNNILRFSGFVWQGNEEKQRMKLKEKLDKCVKEKLLQICDVLDIPITKATTKKADIIAKLMDFLEIPHPTTDELLAEKEQLEKRRKGSEYGQTTSNRSAKRRRTDDSSKIEAKKSAPVIDDSEEKEEKREAPKDNVTGQEEKNSDSQENFDELKDESGKDAGKPGQGSDKVSGKKIFAQKAKTKNTGSSKMANSLPKTQKKQSSKPSKAGDSNDASREVENEDGTNGNASNSSATKEKSQKNAAKGKVKSKKAKPSDDDLGKTEPRDDELKNAIYDLMKVVDFNTTTFIDMTNRLGQQFNTNLRPRIYFIKDVIAEELERLSKEADEADANAAYEAGAKADDKADDDDDGGGV